jgi:hypothetical protein
MHVQLSRVRHGTPQIGQVGAEDLQGSREQSFEKFRLQIQATHFCAARLALLTYHSRLPSTPRLHTLAFCAYITHSNLSYADARYARRGARR